MRFKLYMLLSVLVFSSTFLVSCVQTVGVRSISVDSSTVLLEYETGTFNLEDIVLNVTMSDGSVLNIKANESMISEEDLAKISTIGEHVITLTYLNFTTTLTVNIVYDDLNEQLHSIYLLAVEADQTSLTYEEWLETIRGATGANGREIELRVTETYIQWKYTDEETWTSLIEISMLIGQKGEQGLSAYEIYLQYHPEYVGDEETWINDLYQGSLAIDQKAQVIFQLDGGYMPNEEPLLQEIHLLTSMELPIPIKDGYVFLGWYTGNTINDIQFNSYTIFSRDTILYARWEILDYRITLFDESEELISSVVTFGTSLNELFDTNTNGYNFLGWFTDINYTNRYDSLTTPGYDLILYGLWEILSYEISFVTYNDQILSSITLEYEEMIPEFESPTDGEYSFMGWYLDEELTIRFDLILMPDFDFVLYAKWENNFGEVIDFSDLYPQKTGITIWIDDENGEYMQAVIAEFNKIYPNIIVEHQHMGSVDARELLKIFGPSGNGADVFQFPHDHLAQAVLEDLVYPLPVATQTLLATRANSLALQIATLTYDETNKSFDPASPNAVERLYAVPMSIESVGLFYNTDLVTTPAATFEELFTAADVWNAQLASDGSGLTNAQKGWFYLGTSSHWADSYFMQPIYSAFGFYPFGDELNDPSAVGFESAEAIAALTWIRDELKPRTTGTGNHNSVTAGANFEAGKIPYIIGGPWNHEAYQAAEGLNFAATPMPSINGNETQTFAGSILASVYKYSDNKEDAIKFVEFLNSDIAMQLQYEYKGKLPALQSDLLADIEGVNENQLLMDMADQLLTSIPMPTIPQVTYYWGPGETMLIDVWNNGIAPATAAATAEASYRTRVGL